MSIPVAALICSLVFTKRAASALSPWPLDVPFEPSLPITVRRSTRSVPIVPATCLSTGTNFCIKSTSRPEVP